MSFKPTIIDAILSLKPDAKVIIKDEDYDSIIWEDGNPTSITKTQIETKLSELTTAHDSKTYARKRAEEYPSIQDFMEAYTEKEIGGDSTKWDAYVVNFNKVRSDNPK